MGIINIGGGAIKYSIYNTSWDGLSQAREMLETYQTDSGQRFNINNSMSSLHVLNRFYEPAIVASIGPIVPYTQDETISLLAFLAKGGSLVIADDFGSGNDILALVFNILEQWSEFAEDGLLPYMEDFFGQGDFEYPGDESSNDTETQSIKDNTPIPIILSEADLVGQIAPILIFKLLTILRRIGFNQTILMDAGSNTGGVSSQPLLTNTNPSHPLAYGITKGVQMEFGTCISLKVRNTVYLDSDPTSSQVREERVEWVPLQAPMLRLSIEVSFLDEPIEFELPSNAIVDFLIPFYTSQTAWMESDFQAARRGEAIPEVGEWGNINFAPVMTLPIGFGKIILIGDPDIFANKWVSKTSQNDNMQFVKNLFSYAAEGMNTTADGRINIIFDEGHAQHNFLSAASYSTTFMRLITTMSMYPFTAPFVPIFAIIMSYPLLPKRKRLGPALFTKYRGEKGKSKFDRDIRRIIETNSLDEAVKLYHRLLLSEVRKGTNLVRPTAKDIAEYVSTFDVNLNVKETTNNLKRIEVYLAKPKYLPETVFIMYMSIIKNLLEKLPKYQL